MNAEITALLSELEALLMAGKPGEARAVLLAKRPALDAELVLVAADIYAACGRPRRAAALLWLAARRLGTIGTARAAARALLTLGRHRRARLVLEPHAADGAVAVLMAVARSEPLPLEVLSPVDIDEVLDHALSQPTSTTTLTDALSMSPTSTRARLAVVARLRAEGARDESRAVLRAGLKGREDARLELPLAMAAIDDGAWDEAALVLARARARHPDLARRADLRLVLAWVTLQAGRRDDAISTLRGASGNHDVDAALLALLDPTTSSAPAAPTSAPMTTAPQPLLRADGPPKRPATKIGAAGPVAVVDAIPEQTSPWFRRAAMAVAAIVVLVAVGRTVNARWPRSVDVVDAGAVDAGVDASVAAAFSRRADQCGVAFPAVLEPGLLYAEVAARWIASGYNGQAVSAGDVVVRLDDALASPGEPAAVRVLQTAAGVHPGVVIVDEKAIGLALAHGDDGPRPRVDAVVQTGRMGLGPTSTRPCAAANPGFTCVTARSTCQELEVIVGALCPDGAKSTAELGACAFDVVVVRTPVVVAVDAGVVVVDAGVVDGGSADAGVVDGGSADAGVVDGGSVDGGSVVDGGAADAGSVVDGGVADAGVVVDAGQVDGG